MILLMVILEALKSINDFELELSVDIFDNSDFTKSSRIKENPVFKLKEIMFWEFLGLYIVIPFIVFKYCNLPSSPLKFLTDFLIFFSGILNTRATATAQARFSF